ncbi:hypothetical protein P261_01556 [Lachnospiraceae bacterium TWA4]|nr:hypothetical protein P261_01556 [Lachnospiraceae bacterium TWA4]
MASIGDKIRSYREFKGYSQIELAKLSEINVGTIRKYELGIRNPKPDQLEKIASALGLNVSVFLDLNVQTVGDVLSLLFTIDENIDLDLIENNDGTVGINFNDSTLQKFLKMWYQFKKANSEEKDSIHWKLETMGTTPGCHEIISKKKPIN